MHLTSKIKKINLQKKIARSDVYILYFKQNLNSKCEMKDFVRFKVSKINLSR